MKIARARDKSPRIEMLPLIDIVFLVLVVFIYAMLSMVVHRGIPVVLPAASTAVHDQKDYLSVSISKEGLLFFNKQRYSLEELDAVLSRLDEESKSKPLYINADKQTEHGLVVSVLDLVRKNRITQVVIEAKERQK